MATVVDGADSPVGGLQFSTPWIDLGRVKSVGNIERRFEFVVTSTKPVEILEVRPSCGCLRPRFERRSYAAGEAGAIVLGIHATSQKPGKHRFQLSVTTREDRIRTYEVGVDIELYSDVTVEPSNLLIHVSGTSGKAALKQTITILDSRCTTWRIAEAKSNDPRISIQPLPMEIADAKTVKRVLEVAVNGEFPIGRHESRIEVLTTDPEYRVFEIPVTVSHEPRVSALPEKLIVSRSALSSAETTRVLLIRDNRGGAVRIESASASHPGIRVEVAAGKSPRPICSLRFDKSKIEPPILAEVRLRIVEPQMGDLIVPIRID